MQNQTSDQIKLFKIREIIAAKLEVNKITYKIGYVEGCTGSGKTEGLINYIKENPKNKIIIVVPTIKLAEQYEQALAKKQIKNFFPIHSGYYAGEVHSQISKHATIINNMHEGIMIITLESFKTITYGMFGDHNTWSVFVDEIPAVDSYYSPCLPYNNSFIFDNIELDDSINPKLSHVKLKDDYDASKLTRNNDDIDNVFNSVLKDLENRHIVYTDVKSWENLERGIIVDDIEVVDLGYGNQHNMFYFVSLMPPYIFLNWKSCTIIGANFLQSMLHEVWSKYFGIEFVENNSIASKLRYTSHNNGNLLKIVYLQEQNWSKHCAEKIAGNKTIKELHIEKAQQYFKDNNVHKVLSVMNKSDEQKYKPSDWTLCPVISHGINSFQDHTGIYFGAALNRPPKHIAMLAEYGIHQDYTQRCTAYEIAYQNISRTAIRDISNDKLVTVILPDEGSANAIAVLFPGCTIGPIDGVLRKTQPKTNTNRSKKSRCNELVEHAKLNGMYAGTTDEYGNIPVEPSVFANLYSTRYADENITDDENIYGSVSKFVKELKKYFTNQVMESKKDNILLNAVTYKNTSRKLEDAIYSSALFMDIDDGDMTPEEFHDIFSNKYPTSHIVCNSASRDAESPNRYRAIFFVSEIMSNDTYKVVFNHLVDLIDRSGFKTAALTSKTKLEEYYESEIRKNPDVKFSGVDLSKNNLSSIFYAPCTIIGKEEYAFFWTFGTDDRIFKKYTLSPSKILKHTAVPVDKPKPIFVRTAAITSTANNDKHYQEIINIINSMCAGDRSYKATIVGGMLKRYSHEKREEIFLLMAQAGCDKSAIKSARKYADSAVASTFVPSSPAKIIAKTTKNGRVVPVLSKKSSATVTVVPPIK